MKKFSIVLLTFLLVFVTFVVKADEKVVYNPDDLSDYFGTMKACDHEGGSNDCKNGNEYKFYLKMYDMYYLYKNKYNIKLDLPLIMAALYYGNEELPVVYKKNLNNYNRNELKNNNIVTNLDWEYDFKNDDCYTYLNANDFSFDMQILAKNMVKKEITYTCKSDSEDEEEDNNKSETLKAENIETSNYSKDTLKCEDGEYDKDSVKESYQLDMEQYKKFLLEYIKLKYHTKGSPIKSCSSAITDNGSGSTIVSKTGQEAIDKMNQIAVEQIGNRGDKYESWYGMYADWCAMFVSWLFNQVGGLDKYIIKSAIAGEIPRASDRAGYGTWYEDECTDPSTVPKPGDVIVFDPWIGGITIPYPANGNDKYYSSHVGYVYKVDNEYVYSIEGNGSLGGYNGVWEHKRARKACGSGVTQGINGYFRPNY